MPDKNTFLNSTESSRFHPEDLLYSRTDKRGVIQFANQAFVDTSTYSWADLSNAPHKIMRHPNMPQGVFHLIWNELGRDNSVGGYVQNLAKDGTHYWVFAVMAPIEGGYVSLCVKPLGPLLSEIKEIYEGLRTSEWSENTSPKESAEAFQISFKKHGYQSYSEFMSKALQEEISARNEAIDKNENPRLNTLSDMAKAVAEIEKHSHDVARIFEETKQIPHNMRLQAQRLEGRDGPIGVISGNHHEMMRSLEGAVNNFSAAAADGGEKIERACFDAVTIILSSEVTARLKNENIDDSVEMGAEIAHLVKLAQQSENRLVMAVRDLASRARSFIDMCRDIRRVMAGLEMTRIMCKIERSNLTVEADGLDETIADLNRCERELTAVIVQIESNVEFILMSANRMSERAAA